MGYYFFYFCFYFDHDDDDYVFFLLQSNQGSAFDFGELEEAIVLQGVEIRNDEAGRTRTISFLPFPCFLFFSFSSDVSQACNQNQLLEKAKEEGKRENMREKERFEYVLLYQI